MPILLPNGHLYLNGTHAPPTQEEFEDCCCACVPGVCGLCNTGTTPCELEVVVAGLANNTCETCDTLNGTYILKQEPSNWCVWNVALTLCGVPVLITVLLTNVIHIPSYGYPPYLDFQLPNSYGWVGPVSLDCSSWSGIVIPSRKIDLGPDDLCDGRYATVTVTALPN